MTEPATELKPPEEMTVAELKTEIRERDADYKTGGVPKRDLVAILTKIRSGDQSDQGDEEEVLAGVVEEEEPVAPTSEEAAQAALSEQTGGAAIALDEAHSQALELREKAVMAQHALPGAGEFNAIMAIADRLAASRIVPVAYQGRPDNIVAAVMMGRELGIGPMQSLKDISVIDDKPALAASLLLGLLKKNGVVILESGVDDELAFIKARRSDTGEVQTVEWTYAEAEKVTDKKGRVLADKANWRNYRNDMLWARCVGRLARRLGPDLVAGMGYTAEEVADFDDDWGSEYGSYKTPVYKQDAPENVPPRNAAEVLQRLSALVGADEATEWLREAVVEWSAAQSAPVETYGELSPHLKKVLGQKLAGVVLDLEERESTTGEDLRMATDVRQKVAAVFGKRLDGVALHGPPWRLGPDEPNLPTLEQVRDSASGEGASTNLSPVEESAVAAEPEAEQPGEPVDDLDIPFPG
jgi:hypothetical protein